MATKRITSPMSPRLIDSEAIMSVNQQAEEVMKQAKLSIGDQVVWSAFALRGNKFMHIMDLTTTLGKGPYTITGIVNSEEGISYQINHTDITIDRAWIEPLRTDAAMIQIPFSYLQKLLRDGAIVLADVQ